MAIFSGVFLNSVQHMDRCTLCSSSIEASQGWLFTCVHCRLGPALTILVGILLQIGGNVGLWAAVTGWYTPPYAVVLLLSMVACNAQTWFEGAAMVTSVRNFETER